jgi:hypothetical protein
MVNAGNNNSHKDPGPEMSPVYKRYSVIKTATNVKRNLTRSWFFVKYSNNKIKINTIVVDNNTAESLVSCSIKASMP